MTLLQPDMVQEFYDDLKADATLSAIQGLLIEKRRRQGAIDKTGRLQPNQLVIIRKERCGTSQWCNGGAILSNLDYIGIDIICKTGKNEDTDARDLCKVIHDRINAYLFSASFNGTGWKEHKLVSDRYPVPPTKMLAYNTLTFECLVMSGEA
jgi:hypothetical protein